MQQQACGRQQHSSCCLLNTERLDTEPCSTGLTFLPQCTGMVSDLGANVIRHWPEAELVLSPEHALQGHYPLFGTATQYGKDSGAYPGNYNSWANVSP